MEFVDLERIAEIYLLDTEQIAKVIQSDVVPIIRDKGKLYCPLWWVDTFIALTAALEKKGGDQLSAHKQ